MSVNESFYDKKVGATQTDPDLALRHNAMDEGLATSVTPTQCVSTTMPQPYIATATHRNWHMHRDSPIPQLPHTTTLPRRNSPDRKSTRLNSSHSSVSRMPSSA